MHIIYGAHTHLGDFTKQNHDRAAARNLKALGQKVIVGGPTIATNGNFQTHILKIGVLIMQSEAIYGLNKGSQ